MKQVVLRASKAQVWALWTTLEGVCSWLATDAQIELRLGGPYELYFENSPENARGTEGCRILALAAGRMLTFQWIAPHHLARARTQHTSVVLEFSSCPDGTRLTLTQMGWPTPELRADPQWSEAFAYFDRFWDEALEALRTTMDNSPANGTELKP